MVFVLCFPVQVESSLLFWREREFSSRMQPGEISVHDAVLVVLYGGVCGMMM